MLSRIFTCERIELRSNIYCDVPQSSQKYCTLQAKISKFGLIYAIPRGQRTRTRTYCLTVSVVPEKETSVVYPNEGNDDKQRKVETDPISLAHLPA